MLYDQEFTAHPPDSLPQSGYSNIVDAILKNYGLAPSEKLVSVNKHPSRPYHVFIWKVSLKTPAMPSCFEPSLPYTMKPPSDGVLNVVIRIFNPNAHELVQANRVQTEVASMHLIREGLKEAKKGLEEIIPAVYTWGPASQDNNEIGWILMETKPGIPGSYSLRRRGDWGRDVFIEQMAEILGLIQNIELPLTVTAYGGLTIDDDGNIVTGKAALFGGGPWNSYADLWIKIGGIRERVDALIQKLHDIFSKKVADPWFKLIHGGLMMENILFDLETNKITALLGFSRTCVLHPSMEFVLSFADFGGNIRHNQLPLKTLEEELIDQIVFNAFTIPSPPKSNTEAYRRTTVYWERAMAWDRRMQEAGVTRPSMILGIREIRLIARINTSLWPARLQDVRLTPKQACNDLVEAWIKLDIALRFLEF
ncbi:hypothetical protein F4776DRAFT_663984 [Hypoxylon sp. NC0597]|nr:hypothetical protein F4776DRAFT_663984 [Hypoxylon sp. NC0597]